ncbi:hypothetical protein ACUXK4_002357 [Methylorubrum extorquens]
MLFSFPSGRNFNHATIVVGSTRARREDHGSRHRHGAPLWLARRMATATEWPLEDHHRRGRSEYEQASRHPCCFDKAAKDDRFRAYVTDSLSPVLKPGDTVILDNHGARKVVGKRDGIKTAGVQLLLELAAISLKIVRQLEIISIKQS